MNIPNLDFQALFPSEEYGVISMTPPFDWVDVLIRCDQHIKTFVCRATFKDDDYGKDKGLQIAYAEDLSDGDFHKVNEHLEHSIFANLLPPMPVGYEDMVYRIGLYVQNDEDIWNEYFVFLTTESDGSNLVFVDKNNKELNVLDKGVI